MTWTRRPYPWLDPELPPHEAEEIVLHQGLPAEAFGWYALRHQ